MKKLNRLLKYIIILIVIIIIIIVILLRSIMNIKTDEQESNIDYSFYEDDSPQDNQMELENGIYIEKTPSNFILVNQEIKTYFKYIKEKNNKEIVHVLDERYKNSNNITEENVFNFISEENEYKDFSTQEIYGITDEQFTDYYVYGLLENKNVVEEVYILVHLDYTNFTVSFEPLEKVKYLSLKNNNIVLNQRSIVPNDYNSCIMIEEINKYICNYYIDDLRIKSKYNIKLTYDILDQEYKKKKFENLGNFDEYYKLNQERFDELILEKYSTEVKDNYIQYILIDNMKNYYEIKMDLANILNYTLKLDAYTVKDETYISKYNKLSDKEKVINDVREFVNMVNNRDYNMLKVYLNSNFKNKYFEQREDLIKYIDNNYFKFNFLLDEVKVTNKGEYYVCNYTVLESQYNQDEANKKEKQLIVKLNGDNKYEIAFNMND